MERLAFAFLLTTACVVPQPRASLPDSRSGKSYVAVLSGEMPPPIDLVARHSWIVTRAGDHEERFEYGGGGPGAFDDFTGGDVMLHGVLEGSERRIRDLQACLREASENERRDHPDYFPIPGPNSNTYVDYLLRACKIPIELPSTAIGRDYRGIVGASVTETRTGVQFETPLFGLRLGLVEGIEVHLLSFVFGVHFWPPGITVPVNPGRIGFATDGHRWRPHEIDREHHDDDAPIERKYGLASAWLSLNVERPIDPAKMGGLEGRGTIGFSGRGLYGKRVGYGFGLDFELGAGVPASFAYGVHGYPLGFGVMFGRTGYFGVFAGVGTSGTTTLVEPALEIPVEARLEVDASKWARVGFRGSLSWSFGPPMRREPEIAMGAFARFGKTRRYESDGFLGSGYFIGVERREVLGSAWIGFTLGVESDAAW